ncbi:MAG TPA: hypothetical protein VEA61_09260 [Allosphingosinicella sp.]|nr:hypothetical protein [Allosphingosinicella sp.]
MAELTPDELLAVFGGEEEREKTYVMVCQVDNYEITSCTIKED